MHGARTLACWRSAARLNAHKISTSQGKLQTGSRKVLHFFFRWLSPFLSRLQREIFIKGLWSLDYCIPVRMTHGERSAALFLFRLVVVEADQSVLTIRWLSTHKKRSNGPSAPCYLQSVKVWSVGACDIFCSDICFWLDCANVKYQLINISKSEKQG